MRTCFKILTAIILLGLLLTATGCEKPLDLSMQRSRIFLLGRLLVGKTCDVRLIYRVGPDESTPAQVTADLSKIGGEAEQVLAPGDNGTWRWTGQVVPPSFGEKIVPFTALDASDKEYLSAKAVQVHNAEVQVIAIDCGENQSIALKADGTVADLKLGLDGGYVQCHCCPPVSFHAPVGLDNVVAVAAAFYNSLALKADGTVVSWSFINGDCSGNFIVPANLTDVVAIAASQEYNLALKADGTVEQWSDERCGSLKMPQGLSDVVALAAGTPCAHALKADGTVVAWLPGDFVNVYPDNYCDVPKGIANVVAIDAGENTLALKEDGSVVMWGGHGDRVPVRAGGFKAKAVAAGYGHWMALLEDGTVMIWWKANNTHPYLYYISHTRLKNIIAIAEANGACMPISMALTVDGSVLAWLEDWNGQRELTVTDAFQ